MMWRRTAAAVILAILSTNVAGAQRVLFVDSSARSGAQQGTASAPYATISRAAAVAGPGDVVTIKGGVYPEAVTLTRSGTAQAPITFRCAPGERVVMDGADSLTGFTPAAPAGRASTVFAKSGYATRYRAFGDAAYRDRMTRQGPEGVAQIERRSQGDMIWLDGRLLPEADSLSGLSPRAFYVDRDKSVLYLALDPGDAPQNHRVEYGARGTLFGGSVSYIRVQGLEFTRAAPTSPQAALQIGAPSGPSTDVRGWVVEDSTITWSNWRGIGIRGADHVIRRNVFENNGDEGFAGAGCENLVFDDNVSSCNNWQRGIRTSWEAGGGKFTNSKRVAINNLTANFNRGPGLWFDINNSDVTITNCRMCGNAGVGIMIEESPGPVEIRNNICCANNAAGIEVAESNGVTVKANVLADNIRGVELRNILGRSGDGASPEKPWKLHDIIVSDNVLLENSSAGIANTAAPIDPAADRIVSTGNLFWRNPPEIWRSGQQAAVKLDASSDWSVDETPDGHIYRTLGSVRSALGLEAGSTMADPGYEASDLYEYDAQADSPAAARSAGPNQAGASDAQSIAARE